MFTWWDIDSTPYRRSKCFLLWKHLGNFWRTQKRQTLLDYLPFCFLCEAAHEASCYSVIKKMKMKNWNIHVPELVSVHHQTFYGSCSRIDEGWMAVHNYRNYGNIFRTTSSKWNNKHTSIYLNKKQFYHQQKICQSILHTWSCTLYCVQMYGKKILWFDGIFSAAFYILHVHNSACFLLC